MKVVIQRVKSAAVTVDQQPVSQIGSGLLVLVGVSQTDTAADAAWIAKKIINLRIFDDSDGIMNCSILDISGAILVVSQFTLYGNCKKGNRPSYIEAAGPADGRKYYEEVVRHLRESGLQIETGIFQADMQVSLVNDGPVTLIMESNGRGAE